MGQTHDAITQHLAERWCWQVARRDEARIARRLSRQPLVEGVYRLDDGAVMEDFCHCLDQVGVRALRAEVRGAPPGNAPRRPVGRARRPEDAGWPGAPPCAARMVVQR